MPKTIKPTQNAVPYTAENWAKFLAIKEQLLKQTQTKRTIKAEVVIAATLILMGINLVIGSQFTNTYQPKTVGTISSGVNEKV